MAYTPKYDYRAKDSLPSGNTAKVIRGTELMEDFEKLGGLVDNLETEVGTAKAAFASLTYNGETAVGSPHNIKQESGQWVEWVNQEANGQPNWKFAKIRFAENLQPVTTRSANGDVNAKANVQVTAFSTAVSPTGFVFPVIVDLEIDFVVVAFLGGQSDGSFAPVWDTGFCLAVFES